MGDLPTPGPDTAPSRMANGAPGASDNAFGAPAIMAKRTASQKASLGEKKQSTAGFSRGARHDSSTDRNPDRSSSDDGIGATAATDTHLGADNSGSAGSPRDSNKAFLVGMPGQCKRENLHPR